MFCYRSISNCFLQCGATLNWCEISITLCIGQGTCIDGSCSVDRIRKVLLLEVFLLVGYFNRTLSLNVSYKSAHDMFIWKKLSLFQNDNINKLHFSKCAEPVNIHVENDMSMLSTLSVLHFSSRPFLRYFKLYLESQLLPRTF